MTSQVEGRITGKEFFDILIRIVKAYRPELVLQTYQDYPVCLKVEFRDE